MTRTLSISETKRNLSAVVREVASGGEAITIENHGRPQAVLLAAGEYERLLVAADKARRLQALNDLRAVADRVSARNTDLTEEQIEELTSRAVHEVIDDMAREGKLIFERDLTPARS